MSTAVSKRMLRLSLVCLCGLVLVAALASPARGYSRVILVEVRAPSSVRVDEQTAVIVDIRTGNNVFESVTDVQAMLILPEGANLTSKFNPVLVGTMGPGPAGASCNWTLVFSRAGSYDIAVNVSCLDTQGIFFSLANLTTVDVYDFPHVEFTYSEKTYANHTVIFDASKSYSLMSGTIVSYQWDFGDGTNITTASPVVEHTFSTVGNYTVLLNVTDSQELSSVAAHNVRASLFGDINLDNAVNILDVSIVALSYGSHPGDEKWNAECDLNDDNIIDIVDLSLVAVLYGTTV